MSTCITSIRSNNDNLYSNFYNLKVWLIYNLYNCFGNIARLFCPWMKRFPNVYVGYKPNGCQWYYQNTRLDRYKPNGSQWYYQNTRLDKGWMPLVPQELSAIRHDWDIICLLWGKTSRFLLTLNSTFSHVEVIDIIHYPLTESAL